MVDKEKQGQDPLAEVRCDINRIDEQLQDLLNQRAACALRVGEIKQQSKQAGDDLPMYRAEREATMLREIAERNQGPMSDDTMKRLFREVISACLAMQQEQKIAYLGPVGTYTQTAALKHFGRSVDTVPLSTIDEVFREVSVGSANFGVVPIENSTEGVVTHTLDTFLESDLKICGEVIMRIHHNLISSAQDFSSIKTVYAHQQSLAQCREWLNANLPHVDRVVASSNGEAVRIAQNDSSIAAIAGESAAEIYGLPIMANNIEDLSNNTTRFLIIGPSQTGATGNDKTSLMVSARNKPGALFDLLKPLAMNEREMTRIESRPSKTAAWEYVFFLDVVGHIDDAPLARSLRALEQEAALFKVLGSYPCAVLDA